MAIPCLLVAAAAIVPLRAAAAPVEAGVGHDQVSPAPVVGSDISWPQCGQNPPAGVSFGIVGVNDGRPYTANPCLTAEARWAPASVPVQFYLNTANPGLGVSQAYSYGYGAANDGYRYATARVAAGPGHQWWLDVETANSWSSDVGANTAAIAGALAFFRAQGVQVGIYSTVYQWGIITGGARIPSVANWVPGARSQAEALALCTGSRSFSGGPVVLAQFTTQFDYDVVCPGIVLPKPLPPPPPPNVVAQLLVNLVNWLKGL